MCRTLMDSPEHTVGPSYYAYILFPVCTSDTTMQRKSILAVVEYHIMSGVLYNIGCQYNSLFFLCYIYVYIRYVYVYGIYTVSAEYLISIFMWYIFCGDTTAHIVLMSNGNCISSLTVLALPLLVRFIAKLGEINPPQHNLIFFFHN